MQSGVELFAIDAEGRRVDFERSHASIDRSPPARDMGRDSSSDALRYLVVGSVEALPSALSFVSKDTKGATIDNLVFVSLKKAPCPADSPAEIDCRITPPIRKVTDDVDRGHPLVQNRSIRATVGGTIEIVDSGTSRRLQSIRVGGPRSTPAGPIERLRAKLRVTIFRDRAGGPPPFGRDDEAAVLLARRQLAWSEAIWGQCGISFGDNEEIAVRVVDPPPPHLLAIGCDLGLPASGGEARVRIEGRDIEAKLERGMTPRVAARRVASAIEAAGYKALISENNRIGPAAFATVDLLVRHRDGELVHIEAPSSRPVSTDPTLNICIGEVDLSDGLDHFTDVDAPAGTVEERTLIKSLDDRDPSVIEVILIGAFARGGRIGESFIFADRSSIRNLVLMDRAGVRSDRAAFVLAHELGHVLLDMPGHPDDYGVDTPTLLMDSDAADLSAFGPRRLSLEECARALRQSGPKAPMPLLEPWPLR